MSIACSFPTAKEARSAGWFSRRHETSEAQEQNREWRRIDAEIRREREEAQRQRARLAREGLYQPRRD